MSFLGSKSVVEEGDTVIIYVNPLSMYAIKVTPTIASKKGDMVENVFQTNYGSVKVCELVGKKFGIKIQFSKGWGYLLKPTPELWTLTLPHRTQILYTPDISVIVMQLELKNGSVVIESGTSLFQTTPSSHSIYYFKSFRHWQRISLSRHHSGRSTFRPFAHL